MIALPLLVLTDVVVQEEGAEEPPPPLLLLSKVILFEFYSDGLLIHPSVAPWVYRRSA